MLNPFIIIIAFSLLIIVSYLFSQFSKLSKIPSVLLLLALGIAMQYVGSYLGFKPPNLHHVLRILGITGLMVIVLEGGLDIKIEKSNLKRIGRAAISASMILVGTAFLIGLIIKFVTIHITFLEAVIYALPLSIVSSAIVIPSIHGLSKSKQEFMILESTFSDILGIMFFEFWIMEAQSIGHKAGSIATNVLISVVLSVALSFVLVVTFNKIKTKIKFFLFLSILALLFSVGEYFHFSALLIILIFAVILNNFKLFFQGKLKRFIDEKSTQNLRDDFNFITLETSFIIRTFFFFVFGYTLNLDGIFNTYVIIVSLSIILSIIAIRYLSLFATIRTNFNSILLLAPRGLVSILLYTRITEVGIPIPFSEGIIALVVIGSNIVMMLGLILFKKDTLE